MGGEFVICTPQVMFFPETGLTRSTKLPASLQSLYNRCIVPHGIFRKCQCRAQFLVSLSPVAFRLAPRAEAEVALELLTVQKGPRAPDRTPAGSRIVVHCLWVPLHVKKCGVPALDQP